MTTTLTERLSDWHQSLAVDPTTRLVRNIALAGCESRNGYRYTEAALRAAVPLYDRKPVFLDHAPDRSRPHDRSTRDLVGTIVSPRFEAGRLRADIQVLDTSSGRTFLSLAASNAPGVGMSHVVLARRTDEGQLIETIEDVISVDVVINPATTTTFRESTSPAVTAGAASVGAGNMSEANLSETDKSAVGTGMASTDPAGIGLVEAANDLLPGVTGDRSGTLPSVVELMGDLQRLQQRLVVLEQKLEQEVHAQRMDALLLESGLPGYALTPGLQQRLHAASSDDERRALLREQAELIQRAARATPVSQSRGSDGGEAASRAAFLAVLKRR